MKKHLLLVFSASGLFACSQTNVDQLATGPLDEPAALTTACYVFARGNDTIQLQLHTNSSRATGKLTYALFEKDRNTGTVEGEFRGDTLFAAYTFQSEGRLSVREVAFMRQGDSLVEGFGEMAEDNGQMRFTDAATLRFNEIVLEKVPCAGMDNFAVTGTVTAKEFGKDGYTATLKAADGKAYQAVISIVNMAESATYKELQIGDTVTVYGEPIRLGDVVSIKVTKMEE